jgi:hypothetical protein
MNIKKGFFPNDFPNTWRDLDLIFTIACFYDADDPVAFAKAVAERLKPDGIWCVEVADANKMAREGGWDAICHEHLCYYDAVTFNKMLVRAGMEMASMSLNDCNGGSLRFYVKKGDLALACGPPTPAKTWDNFALRVQESRKDIRDFLWQCYREHVTVHLLGASTKANTWLQSVKEYAGVIQYASDRDPRKVGRRTPGTAIPIISEEESRARKPDVYVVGPWHFRSEIVQREKEFLDRGGRLVFPLPRLEVVRGEDPH